MIAPVLMLSNVIESFTPQMLIIVFVASGVQPTMMHIQLHKFILQGMVQSTNAQCTLVLPIRLTRWIGLKLDSKWIRADPDQV